MTDLSKIKAKIAALLAKANGTDNEHEAAAFAGKAQAMLEEYQLSLYDLGEDDPMGHEKVFSGTPSSPTWKTHLVTQIARLYGCDTIKDGTGFNKWDLKLHGRESARITAQLMIPFIFEQCRAAGRDLAAKGHAGSAEQLTRRVANALASRIYQMCLEADKNREEVAGKASAHALVVVNELRAYIEDLYPNLRKGISRTKRTTAAAKEAANNISLSRQMGGNGNLRIGNK